MTETAEADAYRGLPGAFWYAFHRSESSVFRLYVLVGGLAAVLLGFLFVLGLIVVIDATLDASASLSLSRSFVILIGLAVIFPLLAPVIFVARRHRHELGNRTYDTRLGLAGFGFLGALYVGLIPTVPSAHQSVPSGSITLFSVDVAGVTLAPAIPAPVVDSLIAPMIDALYSLPWFVGLGFAIAAALSIFVVHRRAS